MSTSLMFAVLALLLVATVDAADKRCVTLFDIDPTEYEICKTTECIIFRTEIPFIWIPDEMNKTEHQKPFPCVKYKDTFNKLRGPFFDIVNATEPLRNAQCVWGGTDCQFDDMVEFVGRTSRKGDHKFIAGGLLFMLRYRVTTNTVASAPLLDDQLIIIGPRDDDGTSFATAWETIWRPFSTRAWVLIFLTILAVLFMRLWISYHFTVPWSWHQFRDNFFGDYTHTLQDIRFSTSREARYRNPTELRRLNMYITNYFKIFFVIVVLYFEISIVNHIFAVHSEKLEKLLPKQFVITGNTTMSKMFKSYMRGQQEFGGCSNSNLPCWKEVESIAHVYDTITEQNNTKSKVYRYSAVYETLNRYWFKQNSSLCNELQVLEYSPLNRRFAGVWYYSSNILLPRRNEIDQAIVALREEDQIRAIVHSVTGAKLPHKCQNNDKIDYLQLGMPLFLFAGPIFVIVFVYMVIYTIRSRRGRRTHEVDKDDDDLDDIEALDDESAVSSYRTSKNRDAAISQISVCTGSTSLELFGEFLEKLELEARIGRLNQRRK